MTVRPVALPALPGVPVAGALLTVLGVLLGGCTSEPGTPTSDPAAPPAACLLDTAALASATGVTWVPDTTTATDMRCVYDPGPGRAGGIDFVAVDVSSIDVVPAVGPATELDVLDGACADDSRAALRDGFVCRFPGGSVFAAAARDGGLITITASAVPVGTTAAALVGGFTEQLGDPAR